MPVPTMEVKICADALAKLEEATKILGPLKGQADIRDFLPKLNALRNELNEIRQAQLEPLK